MQKFTEWLIFREQQDKCVKCGASGTGKYDSFIKVQGKTYCDACARQVRREENK